jgi:hypothetical protein
LFSGKDDSSAHRRSLPMPWKQDVKELSEGGK